MSLQTSASNEVHRAVIDGLLSVTIDRAEKRNALSLNVLEDLRRIFTDAASDPTVRVALITGAGAKAFSAGGDLGELMNHRKPDDAEALARHGKRALDAVRFFPVPVIARLNGVALGGGAELALACDLRFAAPHAGLGFVHGRLRISAPWGGGADLLRLVGPSKALRLMATAAIVDSNEAQALGIFDLVCPSEDAFETWFDQQVAVFLRQPRSLLRAYKSMVNAPRFPDAREAERLQREQFCELWCHDDHWNAVAELRGRGS